MTNLADAFSMSDYCHFFVVVICKHSPMPAQQKTIHTKDGPVTFTVKPKRKKPDKVLTDWQLAIRKAHANDSDSFKYKGDRYSRHRKKNPNTGAWFYYYKSDEAKKKKKSKK